LATNPTPMPDPSASSPQGGAGAPPPQSGPPQGGGGGQASQLQSLLAQWYQVSKQIAASDPRLASGMEKVAQGIQEAQTALVSPPQPTPIAQQPSYA
jgi:hypothetical protein